MTPENTEEVTILVPTGILGLSDPEAFVTVVNS